MHERVQATVGNREIVSRDYRGWENDMHVLTWHDQKEREGLRDLSREAVVDHVRDRFWAHDHSAVREAERATSMSRTIERAYARTGRERPEPTVQIRTQERDGRGSPSRTDGSGSGVGASPHWQSALGYLSYARTCNYGEVHPQNQERFWTERAAMDAGYRRAANDHYGPGSGQAREAAEERAHTDAWMRTKRQRQLSLGLGPDSDDMHHGAHVQLDDKEHSR